MQRSRIGTSGTRILAPLIAVLGVVIIVRTVTAGGGALSVGVLLGAVFVAIGARSALPEPRGSRVERPPRRQTAAGPALPRRAVALGHGALLDRLLDLLRPRHRRRPRPRADARHLRLRRPRLRGDDDDLRRGRRDVQRARRLEHARPARVQRARQLHRGLGDPDRLRDRDRAGRDHGAALPLADLGGPGHRNGRGGDRAGDHRGGRSGQHSSDTRAAAGRGCWSG